MGFMSFQQQLIRRIWRPKKQEIEIKMIIRGKIISVVRLNDIKKNVEFGKEVSLNEYEVNRSNDLQNAIKRDWVEIIYDRSMIKRSLTVQGQQETKTTELKTSETEILNIAKKMATSMAEEMIKNSSFVKNIAKEVAKEMIIEIKDNLKFEQTTQQNTINNKIPQKIDNIFIDFKDDEVGITENIKELGQIREQKVNISNSLEKMRTFTRKNEEKNE